MDGAPAGGSASTPPPAAPPPRVGSARSAGDSHADFLITSAERDAAEARLRHAVADEVLSLEEFGDRMRLLLEARTRGDLHAAVAGLPVAREPRARTAQRGHAQPARRRGSAYAILSSAETRGRWQPQDSTTAVAVMGELVIDPQGVEFEGDELVPLRGADAAAVRREQRRSRLASVRRRAVGALAAIALALPLGWVLSADDVAGAVFGSASQTVSAAELDAGGVSIGAPVAFGSVDIQVPEGVNVDRDGVVVFGSTSCEPACAPAVADAPTVQVRTLGAFGSVEITQVPAPGAN